MHRTGGPIDARARLSTLAISPSGFVFDPGSGASFTVNETGRIILEGVRDGLDLDAITVSLSEYFEADGADLARDVLEYVCLMREHGLVPAAFELR